MYKPSFCGTSFLHISHEIFDPPKINKSFLFKKISLLLWIQCLLLGCLCSLAYLENITISSSVPTSYSWLSSFLSVITQVPPQMSSKCLGQGCAHVNMARFAFPEVPQPMPAGAMCYVSVQWTELNNYLYKQPVGQVSVFPLVQKGMWLYGVLFTLRCKFLWLLFRKQLPSEVGCPLPGWKHEQCAFPVCALRVRHLSFKYV